MQTYSQVDAVNSVVITTTTEADLIRISLSSLAGDAEVYLPSAQSVLGRRYTIHFLGQGNEARIFAGPDYDELIDGVDGYVLTTTHRKITIQAVTLGSQTYGYVSL